jgi:phospholipase C
MIRFVQERFGTKAHPLTDPNITPWRKAVCGDLTSAFNFATPNDATVKLPSTSSYVPPDNQRHVSYIPLPPAIQTMPVQEKGTRPARAVPYSVNAAALVDLSSQKVTVMFLNTGAQTACFQVRSANVTQAPRTYTVSPNDTLTDTWEFAADGAAAYDLSVYGPNGFYRHYRGGAPELSASNLESGVVYDVSANSITLVVRNAGKLPAVVLVEHLYNGQYEAHELASGGMFETALPLALTHGWYDMVITVDTDPNFQQQIAGHLETGKASITDPALA